MLRAYTFREHIDPITLHPGEEALLDSHRIQELVNAGVLRVTGITPQRIVVAVSSYADTDWSRAAMLAILPGVRPEGIRPAVEAYHTSPYNIRNEAFVAQLQSGRCTNAE